MVIGTPIEDGEPKADQRTSSLLRFSKTRWSGPYVQPTLADFQQGPSRTHRIAWPDPGGGGCVTGSGSETRIRRWNDDDGSGGGVFPLNESI